MDIGKAQPGIYVETLIHESLERVWHLTQVPELHQRWDLRVTQVRLLPRADAAEPQRFEYASRAGFGLNVQGTGETVAKPAPDNGDTTAVLKFTCDDPKSLVRQGSGYWHYAPGADGVRFLTWYDYEVRFGATGRFVDRAVLRPLLGWATAWSFDRLRLWAERDQSPEVSMRLSAIHATARITLALIWIWLGLVPKLMLAQVVARPLLSQTGLPLHWISWIGVLEIYLGALLLTTWKHRGVLLVNAVLMVLLTIVEAAKSPEFLGAAFVTVTLSLALLALSIVGWLAARSAPSARRCLRREPKG